MTAEVLCSDDQDDHPVDTARWARLARHVLEAEGVTGPVELSLAFVGEGAMSEINGRFAGEEEPTDVLAFPMDPMDPMDPRDPMDPMDDAGSVGVPALLGDVVICPAVAWRNAAHRARSYEDELALLVVHGILHLRGMDHEEPLEARLMQRREEELVDRFHRSAARASP